MFDIGDNLNALSTLPTRDLDAAIERYEKLGFATTELSTDSEGRFAATKRDAVELRLIEDKTWGSSNSIVFLVATDADALYQEWLEAEVDGVPIDIADLESTNVEGGYIDPDGILFLFANETR